MIRRSRKPTQEDIISSQRKIIITLRWIIMSEKEAEEAEEAEEAKEAKEDKETEK